MTSFITASNLTHPTISHGFFTRRGGASTGEYASLNIGYGSGDDKDSIKENRKRVAKALGSEHEEILTCQQTHSNIAHIVTAIQSSKLQGDALVTDIPSLPIAVLTADCVPVLFADVKAGVIGAAHAGWRGAHAGIIRSTIEAMQTLGAEPANITAAIGPAIQQASFEVGNEVKAQFCALDETFAQFFAKGVDATHFQFNLSGLVGVQISKLGVANVEKLDYDTYSDEARFFSFRRSTHQQQPQYGRQCSAIMLV